MVEVDLSEIRIRCITCGAIHEVDLYDMPIKIECCEHPELTLEDEIELIVL